MKAAASLKLGHFDNIKNITINVPDSVSTYCPLLNFRVAWQINEFQQILDLRSVSQRSFVNCE